MSLQAKVLYDFAAEESSDLGVTAGEIITIINQNYGNGWSEGRNDSGKVGLVPSNYIEILHIPEPNIPPPPVPDEYMDMSAPNPVVIRSIPQLKSTMPNNVSIDEDDSDWEDSDEEPPAISKTNSMADRNTVRSLSTSIYGEAKIGNIRMPKSFLKSGGEEFLLGVNKNDNDIEARVLVTTEDGADSISWEQRSSPKHGQILSHQKQSKFRGMKSFIAYTLKSSLTDNTIEHRYKQFDWLHKQFIEKYPCIAIPPLPSPKVVGRYEDDFIESRRRGLQRWLTHILSHPVLSESFLIKHFLTVTDKNKWTTGKRKAENDQFKGARFYYTVDCPDFEINWDTQSKRMDRVVTFQDSFEKSCKGLFETIMSFNKRQSGPICKEFNKVGASICSLSRSISLSPDNTKQDIALLHAIQKTGESYEKVGKLFAEEGRKDQEMEENIDEVISVTKEIPSLLDLARCSVATIENGYKRSSETKVSIEVVENLDRNVRIISRTVDAELNWLQNQRRQQVHRAMKQYLENQVQLFSAITGILTEALGNFQYE